MKPGVIFVAACVALVYADIQANAQATANAPSRFGIGRPAAPDEIAAVDIDVTPDGKGLPGGAGSAAAGEAVYASKCAVCHGPAGEGARGLAGPLAGRKANDAFDFALSQDAEATKTVGNYWPYATTIFDYVRRSMPFNRPGSLTNDEVYAVTAWILWKNAIIGRDTVMDARSLPRVTMPARDRFVRDDRETTTRVR